MPAIYSFYYTYNGLYNNITALLFSHATDYSQHDTFNKTHHDSVVNGVIDAVSMKMEEPISLNPIAQSRRHRQRCVSPKI